MVKLDVNGHLHEVDVDPDTPLLWVIREWLGMTGTKYGCGIAQCGACTVHLERRGDAVVLDARQRGRAGDEDHDDRGPVADGVQHPVQSAWVAARRAAMRLLPVGPDHGGGGAARRQAEADRRGHRRRDDATSAAAAPIQRIRDGDPYRRGRRQGVGRSRHDNRIAEQRHPRAAASSRPPPRSAAASRSASHCRSQAPGRRRSKVAEVNAWVVDRARRYRASSASHAPRWGRAR